MKEQFQKKAGVVVNTSRSAYRTARKIKQHNDEKDRRINNLEERLIGMESSIDNLVNLLTKHPL